jgi:hypothetical protein
MSNVFCSGQVAAKASKHLLFVVPNVADICRPSGIEPPDAGAESWRQTCDFVVEEAYPSAMPGAPAPDRELP